MMKIQRWESDLLSSNMYIITEDKHAIVIDPCRNTEPVSGLMVDGILLTHEHYDHISGVNLFKDQFSAPVLCSKPCAENITSSRKNMSRLFKVFCELQTWITLQEEPDADEDYRCTADEAFSDRMTFIWYDHRFELFEIPGHSAGSIGIILDGKNFFSGDSLMENKAIELRFPGGNKKQWEEIGKPRLQALPDGIRVYPGHFQDFTLNRERRCVSGLSV